MGYCPKIVVGEFPVRILRVLWSYGVNSPLLGSLGPKTCLSTAFRRSILGCLEPRTEAQLLEMSQQLRLQQVLPSLLLV